MPFELEIAALEYYVKVQDEHSEDPNFTHGDELTSNNYKENSKKARFLRDNIQLLREENAFLGDGMFVCLALDEYIKFKQAILKQAKENNSPLEHVLREISLYRDLKKKYTVGSSSEILGVKSRF